jgi:hypothetical protein
MHHAIVAKESLAEKSVFDNYKILHTKVSGNWQEDPLDMV